MKGTALLHYAGEWVFDIFLNLPDTGDDAYYDLTVAAYRPSLMGTFSPRAIQTIKFLKSTKLGAARGKPYPNFIFYFCLPKTRS